MSTAGVESDDPQTERLVAERPSLQRHLDFVAELNRDPEIARWQYPEAPGGLSRARSREMLENKIAHWERHGFGQWIWRRRSSGEPVGRIGIQWTAATGELMVEVGWSVAPAMQGQGFATEAALASLRYGFERAGCERIVAFTWTENLASLRVMEKLGLVREGEFELAGLPHLLYAATPDLLAAQA